MSRIGLCLTLSVGLAIGVLFAIDPSLDLRGARYFHALHASGALARADTVLFAMREFNQYLVIGLIAFCTIALALQVGVHRAGLPSVRACALILLVIGTGPGLIVNAALKENWSRPRPGAVLASGDETQFRAWWDPSGSCRRNCSFASGEAATAFATLAIAVVSPMAFRYAAVTLALIYGGMIGAARVAVGGHFVSDVVFAGVISALVVWIFHGLIYRWPATRVSEPDARAWLRGAALRLRRHAAVITMAIRRKALGAAPRKRLDAKDAARASHG